MTNGCKIKSIESGRREMRDAVRDFIAKMETESIVAANKILGRYAYGEKFSNRLLSTGVGFSIFHVFNAYISDIYRLSNAIMGGVLFYNFSIGKVNGCFVPRILTPTEFYDIEDIQRAFVRADPIKYDVDIHSSNFFANIRLIEDAFPMLEYRKNFIIYKSNFTVPGPQHD